MEDLGNKQIPEFVENKRKSLLNISMDSNKELWLFQWPNDQIPDFDGKELTLQLRRDGKLGSFECLGRSYELVSFESQEPEATVFQSSESGSKIVGKISRRVSLIHYPEPSELDKSNSNRHGQLYPRSVGASSMDASRRYSSLSRGSRQRSASGLSQVTVTPTRSTKRKSSLFETGESSKHSKKKHNSPGNQFSQDSAGRDRSGISSLGSAGHSEGRKSKKSKHEE